MVSFKTLIKSVKLPMSTQLVYTQHLILMDLLIHADHNFYIIFNTVRSTTLLIQNSFV